MGGWENFFIAQVGASAALAGLVFVGVSINLTEIVDNPGLAGYALEALVVLLNVLVASSILLVPGQSPALRGGAVLAAGFGAWLLVTVQQWRGGRGLDPQYRWPYLATAALGQAATLPFLVAGLALIGFAPGDLSWILLGVVCSFLFVFYLAWTLLVEIKR